MAQSTINVNGTLQVFNAILLGINGDTKGIDINGYLTGLRFTTGSRVGFVQAINPKMAPVDINPINSTPSGSLEFLGVAYKTFYRFLTTGRTTSFNLSFIQYTTGNIGGETATISIINTKLDDWGGSSTVGSPNNTMSVGFKATEIITL